MIMLEQILLNRRAPTLGVRPLRSTPEDEPGSFAKSNCWVGSAISAAGSLLSGIIGNAGVNSRNREQIALQREQNQFNSDEAKKQRDWQEQYYQKYSSPIAQSAQYRAAGLNPYLANIQPQGVASGAQASSGEMAQLENTAAPLGSAVQNGVNSAISAYSAETDRHAQQSTESLNNTLETLNKAKEELTNAEKTATDKRIEEMKLNISYLTNTFSDRVQMTKSESDRVVWSALDSQYAARGRMYEYYNILPEQQKALQNQSLMFAATAFKYFADGKYTLKQCDNYLKEMAIRQTMALAASRQAEASMLNATNQGSYLSHLSDFVDEQKGEVARRNKAFDLPLMHNGKLTKAGLALQYLNYNQNKAALRVGLLKPSLMQGYIDMFPSMKFKNYLGGASDIITGAADAYGKVRGASKPTTQTKTETLYHRDGGKTTYKWQIHDYNNTFTSTYW